MAANVSSLDAAFQGIGFAIQAAAILLAVLFAMSLATVGIVHVLASLDATAAAPDTSECRAAAIDLKCEFMTWTSETLQHM